MTDRSVIRREVPGLSQEDTDAPELLDRLGRTTGGTGGMPQLRVAAIPKTPKRPRYPTDERHRLRAVSTVLPRPEDKERLAEIARDLSESLGMKVTVSGIGAMLLMAGLELYDAGALELVGQTEEINKWFLRPR